MSDRNYHILAYHGWGFDHSIWEPLKSELPEGANFESANRGYFSDSFEPSWENVQDRETEKILLVHSYGLHWCDKEILRNADHLVLLGSFLKFHPAEQRDHKRSKLMLRKMLTQFVDSPKTVLEKFYEEVFYPEEVLLEVPADLNHDRLLSDLSDLDRDNRKNAKIFELNSITIIHGTEDRIVSNDLARQMYTKLRLRSQYFEIKDCGHALPFTHSSKVFEILNSLLHFR